MKKRIVYILALIFLTACDGTNVQSDYLTLSGIDVSISDTAPTQIPTDNNIVLKPSASYVAKRVQVNDASQLNAPMKVQITLYQAQVSNHFLSFLPDDSPDEPIIFSPYDFNFPREWRMTPTNEPGVFEAVIPAQNGVFTLHELDQVASSSDLVGTGETCDTACDDKLCCGKFKCWTLRISVCASEGSDPNACWSCLCEMSWGCLSHDHDRCKSSCNTCNENTWPDTQEHCIDKL